MLSDHPLIHRMYIRENVADGKVMQKLIVETQPRSKEVDEGLYNNQIRDLETYLLNLAQNDFADFREVEVRPSDIAGKNIYQRNEKAG